MGEIPTAIGAGNEIAGYGITAVAGAYAVRFFWRVFSRDRTAVVRDRAEEDIVKVLQFERDQAKRDAAAAYGARDAALARESSALARESLALQKHERLSAEIELLRNRVAELRDEMRQARQEIRDLSGQVNRP